MGFGRAHRGSDNAIAAQKILVNKLQNHSELTGVR